METLTIRDLEQFNRTQVRIILVALITSGLIIGAQCLVYRFMSKKKGIRPVPRKHLKRILRFRGGEQLIRDVTQWLADSIAQEGNLLRLVDTWGALSILGLVGQFLRLKKSLKWYIIYQSVPGNLVKNWPLYKSGLNEKFIAYCDDHVFQFLVQVLVTEEINKTERIRLFRKALKNLNFKDVATIASFIALLLFLYDSHIGIFYKIINELIRLLKSGKISKRVARLLIRRLRRHGIFVDPEFVELAN